MTRTVFSDNSFSVTGFIHRLAGIPIAAVISVAISRLHPQFAITSDLVEVVTPQLLTLTFGYCIAALFLSTRRLTMSERTNSFAVTCLTLAFFFSVTLIVFLRISYSLWLLTTFILISILWILWCEKTHSLNFTSFQYVLVNQQHRQTLFKSSSIDLIPVSNPTELQQSIDSLPNPVLIIDPHIRLPAEWTEVLVDANSEGIPAVHIDQLHEFLSGRTAIDMFVPEQISSITLGFSYKIIKRTLDLILASSGLIFLFPPVAVLGLLVKFESKGSVIYSQRRVGRYGGEFTLFKFRTMYSNSEEYGPVFAEKGDPRVTYLGSFLRRYRLDEVPQFINVLRGDMSLVGPRPERPEWTEKYCDEIPYYQFRHLIRPGITGWAQVMQGYAASNKEALQKLEYDLFYIKRLSLSLDLRIIFKTLSVIFKGAGAK